MPLIIIRLLLLITAIAASGSATDRPIIGVLSQEIYSDKSRSYIAASYVKFVEGVGGRVVPIWIGQNEDYYERVVNYTNGVLFPGGAVYFNETRGYGEAATILYKLAIKSNNQGIYYPVWGTCLGLEVLMWAAAGSRNILDDCSAEYVAMPLEFVPGYNSSKLFPGSSQITHILETENVTFNNHEQCLTVQSLENNNLTDDWRVLSTNQDTNNFTFVSLMEHTKYPFYATQFHAEKNLFEFKMDDGIPHTMDAVQVAQYFANFFAKESRKNENKFPDWRAEAESLIYNYIPTYTGLQNSSFEQKYYFDISDVNASPFVFKNTV